MNLKTLPVRALPILALGLGGCATIAHGSHQDISIKSTPANAMVFIDGKEQGKTPEKVSLARRHPHTIKVVKPGYYPAITKINRTSSGATYFDGLLGQGVDHASGAAYALSPNKINAHLNLKPKSMDNATASNVSNDSGS